MALDYFQIISFDSVQVYKYLDIGSGKPTVQERQEIKHFLIDEVEPDYNFTVGDFCKRALKAQEEIFSRKKIPFFVGGTGLYIDSFLQGLSEIPPIREGLREELKKELDEKGVEALYQDLIKVDINFAVRVESTDRQRITRGLEVFRSSGKPLSYFLGKRQGHESKDTLYLGLYEERDILREIIDKRVDFMIKAGFLEEVRSLRSKGYHSKLKSLQSIGYADINNFLDNKISWAEAIEKIKTETKRYAKRQMTWFKRNKKINWFRPKEIYQLKNLVTKWLEV